MMTETFSKLLAGRHSPKNKCHAKDGAVLFVTPMKNVPMQDHVAHHFLASEDRRTRSKYGWVQEAEPFTMDDFVREYLDGKPLSDEEQAHLGTLFRSISSLPPGTPVAATYSCRGVEERPMVFTVHRVFFPRETA